MISFIPYINLNNSNNRYSQNNKKPLSFNPILAKDKVSFGNIKGRLSDDNVSALDSISYAYKLISGELEQKSEKGIKLIEDEAGVTLYKGIIFKNVGAEKSTVTVVMPQKMKQGDVLKLVVKNKNKDPKSYYIIDSRMVSLSKDCSKTLTSEELKAKNINEELEKIVSEIDPMMLKLRKVVMSRTGKDLRPPDGLLPYDVSSDLNVIGVCSENADKKFLENTLSEKQYLSRNFDRYVPSKVPRFHTFQNLGPEHLTITYGNISSGLHNGLSKLTIQDKNGRLADIYLIKDDKKIVSNFNPDYPNCIPEKLTFYDEFSINKRSKNLEKYTELLRDVFLDFEHYIQKQKLPVPETVKDGYINKSDFDKLTNIFVAYNVINAEFSKLSQPKITELKTTYEGLDCSAGKRGLTFVDAGKKGQNISYYKMQCSHPNLIRIIVNDTQTGNAKYFLIQNGKIVKNYNPNYPNTIPKTLLFYNEDEIKSNNISEYVETLDFCMTDFKNHVNKKIQEKREAKAAELQKKREAQAVKDKIKAGLLPKPMKPPRSKKEKDNSNIILKTFMKEKTAEFKSALEKAQINLDDFDIAIQKIQRQVREFFEAQDKERNL